MVVCISQIAQNYPHIIYRYTILIEQRSGSDHPKPDVIAVFSPGFGSSSIVVSILYLYEQALYHHCDIIIFSITNTYVLRFEDRQSTWLSSFPTSEFGVVPQPDRPTKFSPAESLDSKITADFQVSEMD